MDYTEIRDIVVSDDRPMVYDDGELRVYRASSIGSCTRALVAASLGYRESRYAKTQKILDDAAKEGNLHEGPVLDELRAAGHHIGGGQDTLEVQVIPGVIVRGHVDGIGKPPRARRDRGYEVKTMSQDRFRKWESFSSAATALLSPEFNKYGWQLSAYMHATGLPFIYAVKNRNTGKVVTEEIGVPPVDWKTIRKKVIEVEKWTLRDELPPCEAASGEKWFCPFPALHTEGFGEEYDDEFVPIASVQDVVLVGMAEKHADLTKIARAGDAASRERRSLNEKMITAMSGQKKVQAGGWEIVYRSRKGNPKINEKKLAQELGVDPRTLAVAIKKSTEEGKKAEWVEVNPATI